MILALGVVLCASIPSLEAHPGNTASDGCHYCRTNCGSWGVPWNQRHCHGGGYSDEDPEIEAEIEEYESSPAYYQDRYGDSDNYYDDGLDYSDSSPSGTVPSSDSSSNDEEDYTWVWIVGGVIGFIGLSAIINDN